MLRDDELVLKMRGRFVIARADGPTIVLHHDLVAAHVDHRLDADAHPRLKTLTRALAPVVRDVRFLVHVLADAVAAQLADNTVVELAHKVLHRVADVADSVPCFCHLNRLVKRLFGALAQLVNLLGNFAHLKRVAEVAVVAVQQGAAIHGDAKVRRLRWSC